MGLDQMWNELLEYMSTQMATPRYQTFVSSAILILYEEQILTLQVPNEFSKNWIHTKCEPLIKDFFSQEYMIENIVIEYVIKTEEQVAHTNEKQLTIFDSRKEEAAVVQNKFNEKYTFDTFIVGHNNRFAHAASEAVAKKPAEAYNPLFIYGAAGLGKTHLLHAIGIRTNQTNPNLKVELVSSEKFTNELINSIKERSVEKFREKYRNVDILLVDDIQFLAGKEQTQEEFFHTFNDLHNNRKQIVLTSDRPPKDIPTLEERLRTRFGWGLTADIQAPELETRIAILRKKIELNNFIISDEILHFIASQIPTNVREMEGALTKIVAYASLMSTEVTLSIASNVIRDMIGVKKEKPITVPYIKQKVCEYFQISDQDLCSRNRAKDVVLPRMIAMYLARELTNVSLPKIGEVFGKRDHTTVIHAHDRITASIKEDQDTRNIIQILISNIKTGE